MLVMRVVMAGVTELEELEGERTGRTKIPVWAPK